MVPCNRKDTPEGMALETTAYSLADTGILYSVRNLNSYKVCLVSEKAVQLTEGCFQTSCQRKGIYSYKEYPYYSINNIGAEKSCVCI